MTLERRIIEFVDSVAESNGCTGLRHTTSSVPSLCMKGQAQSPLSPCPSPYCASVRGVSKAKAHVRSAIPHGVATLLFS
eukprot:scaffold918_cov390-Pavlova_lutheri.AAC.3